MNRWYRKFAFASHGLGHAIRTQNSFWVHVPVTIVVIGLGAWLQIESWRWVAIILATSIVMSAELINTSIEEIVRVVHPTHDPRIGRALDVAAAGVLIASAGAVTVGLIALGPPLWNVLIAGG
ncbi:Undecaprenol kinase [Rubripirellula tenax]|uniref:Undecaprenol kinase n=1 Tax=Rubripirellula tenax TaxID=2528015 RepID=A0A5C6ERT5_9BACT|nr:diacylglycerol kinase family protein [Rubripirellula tenax]TWU51064.1 Undecaprenol kinase [Rubripirellula tenax]